MNFFGKKDEQQDESLGKPEGQENVSAPSLGANQNITEQDNAGSEAQEQEKPVEEKEEEQEQKDDVAQEDEVASVRDTSVFETYKVEFEGKRIVAVLEDGKATETLYHCQFEDLSTGHVPKDWLDKTLVALEKGE